MSSVGVASSGTSLPRELPLNIEAEQGLLGTMMMDNRVFEAIAGTVSADDFSQEIHRRVFDIAAKLIGSGQPATPITIKSFLADGDLGGITVSQYLARLSADAMPPLLATSYAEMVRDLATRRKIIAACEQLVDQAYDLPPAAKPDQMAGEAITTLHGIAGQDSARTTRREAHKSAAGVIASIHDAKAGKGRRERVSTGFPGLDDTTEGYQPGTFWVVAARPGMGKTIYAATSANKVARTGCGSLLFSLEVPEEQMIARLLADLAFDHRQPIPFKDIMAGSVDDTAVWLLEDAHERYQAMPLVLDVASRLTPAEIRIRVRAEKERMAAKGVALRVVFIDYMKQIQASDRYRGNRVYEVGEITYSLKQLAKDEGVCIVLLAQLNRALEGREDKRPGLSDLRESGDLETDADVVAFVHREAYYIQRSAEYRSGDGEAQAKFFEHEHKAELILGKNRIGPTKTIDLWCDVACSTMTGAT